jgi:hypothetical protein
MCNVMPAEPDLIRHVDAKFTRKKGGDVGATVKWGLETSVCEEGPLGQNIDHVFSTIDGNGVNVLQAQMVFTKTIPNGAHREAVCMFDAIKPFFLNCRHNLTITDKNGGAIMHGKANAIIFILALATTMHT